MPGLVLPAPPTNVTLKMFGSERGVTSVEGLPLSASKPASELSAS